MIESYFADLQSRQKNLEHWVAKLGEEKSSGKITPEQYQAKIARAILARERLTEREKKKAGIDRLTQIPNRRRFDEELKREVDRAKREKTPLGLLVLDVDHFKDVNDKLGHKAGDAVLQRIAQKGNEILRSTDLLARIGGEEMAVIVVGSEEIATAGERFRKAIAEASFPNLPSPVTVSVGGTLYRPDDTPTTFLERADKAMYQSKEEGRNKVTVILTFDP